MAVGGEREVKLFAVGSAQLGQLADETHCALAQQRFAASDPYFTDSKPGENPRHAQIVGERQVTVERTFVSGAAVNAFIVATVRHRDAEIGDGAAGFVG